MQGKYVECLMLATGYGSEVKASDFIEGINQVFLDWEHLKVKDIMGYRNYAHKSLVTGNEAPNLIQVRTGLITQVMTQLNSSKLCIWSEQRPQRVMKI